VKEINRTFREFLVVGVLGLVIGLVANTANPKGLSLTRNYYPPRVQPPPPRPPHPGPLNPGSRPEVGTQPDPIIPDPPRPNGNGTGWTEEQIIQHLRDGGFQPLNHMEMVEIYHSPYYKDGLYMVIDARNDDFYKEGHIPGAYHLDYYYADQHIDAVLKAYNLADGVQADKIVVYCNGGKCEDSEWTVGYLLEKGIEPHKVFVYGLGFTGWKAKGMPFETGERNSGQITQEAPKNGAPATQEAKK